MAFESSNKTSEFGKPSIFPIELLVHPGKISRNRVSFTTTVGNLYNRRIRHFIPDWLNPFSIERTSPALPFHNFSRSPVFSFSALLRTVLLMLPPGVSYLVSTWVPSSQPPLTNRTRSFRLRTQKSARLRGNRALICGSPTAPRVPSRHTSIPRYS